MDAYHELNYRMQLEALISEREAMIVANKERELRGESPAYGEDHFNGIAHHMNLLLESMRQL